MDGKGSSFAINSDDQIIQPYIDKNIFFKDQWIFADYQDDLNGKPGTFIYHAEPPVLWPEIDRKRAQKHFYNFGLALRYATKAAEILGTVLGQIEAMEKAGLTTQLIISTILEPGINTAPFANHWQKGMYQALTTWLVAREVAPTIRGAD